MKFDMLNRRIRKMRTRPKDIMDDVRSLGALVVSKHRGLQQWPVFVKVTIYLSIKIPWTTRFPVFIFHIASMANNSSIQRSTLPRPQALVLRDKNHCWTALSNLLSSLQNVGNSLFITVQGLSIGRLAITGHEDLGEILVSKVPLWHQWLCRAYLKGPAGGNEALSKKAA